MKDIEQKTNEVRNLVDKYYDQYIVLADHKSKMVMMQKASPKNSLFMVREYIKELRNALTNIFGAKCAEELLKSVLLTPDELREEMKKKQVDEIPAWMRRLMDLEAEADDVEDDEPDDSDDDSDEDEDDDAYSRVCPETAEEKARRKAVDDLVKALRNAIVGDDDLTVSLRSE